MKNKKIIQLGTYILLKLSNNFKVKTWNFMKIR